MSREEGKIKGHRSGPRGFETELNWLEVLRI
jgi:hypothetical protein